VPHKFQSTPSKPTPPSAPRHSPNRVLPGQKKSLSSMFGPNTISGPGFFNKELFDSIRSVGAPGSGLDVSKGPGLQAVVPPPPVNPVPPPPVLPPPVTTSTEPGGLGLPNTTLPVHEDIDFQNLPSLRFLQGLLGRNQFNAPATSSVEGPFGTNLPLSGLLNARRVLDIARDPDAQDALRSLYRGANLNYDTIVAQALRRAPVGNAVPTSGIFT
jgi:hypothetical protein